MTENLPSGPTQQAIAARNRSAPGRVSGKLKIAIDRMVWHGDKRSDAAAAAGMTDNGLRVALKKPHVKREYLAECENLRLSGRARRIHRLEAITEQDENKQAAVNAARALDNMGEDAAAVAGASPMQPGLTIVVIRDSGERQQITPPRQMVDVTPVPSSDSDVG